MGQKVIITYTRSATDCVSYCRSSTDVFAVLSNVTGKSGTSRDSNN